MKTLADFKRRLTLGTKLTCEFHGAIKVVGNLGTTTFAVPPKEERVVAKIQSNAVAFSRPDGKESWLTWPKASEVKFPNDNTVEIYCNGEKRITYCFL